MNPLIVRHILISSALLTAAMGFAAACSGGGRCWKDEATPLTCTCDTSPQGDDTSAGVEIAASQCAPKSNAQCCLITRGTGSKSCTCKEAACGPYTGGKGCYCTYDVTSGMASTFTATSCGTSFGACTSKDGSTCRARSSAADACLATENSSSSCSAATLRPPTCSASSPVQLVTSCADYQGASTSTSPTPTPTSTPTASPGIPCPGFSVGGCGPNSDRCTCGTSCQHPCSTCSYSCGFSCETDADCSKVILQDGEKTQTFTKCNAQKICGR